MKIEQGVVVKKEGEFAYIVPSLEAGCEHCALKDLCIGNTSGKLRALDEVGAREGDLVEYTINLGRLNVNLMLLSGLGLILLLVGAIFGYYVNPFGIDPALSGGIFGIGLSALVFGLSKLKRFSSKELYPQIKRVIRRSA